MEKSKIEDVFEKEFAKLDTIYWYLVSDCMEKVPDYFFSIPASSTGKYHPSYALGEGGLVRHVKATVKIAKELFNLYKFTHREQQLIIVSLLLHDCYKSGLVKSEHTLSEHPVIGAKEFWKNSKGYKLFDRIFVYSCIISHMGQWNKNHDKKVIMPKPFTRAQKFVHLVDYLASRKFLEVVE